MSNRKFWLVVFVYISVYILIWGEHIDSGGFVTLTIGIVGSYLASNVWQKHVTQKKGDK